MTAPEARRVTKLLKSITEMVNEGGPDGRALWHILTALRGPDEKWDMAYPNLG